MAQRERNSPREPGICRLNRIVIVECGEELVNIREYCSGLSVRANPSLLRCTAANMLQQAADALPSGYRLKVNTALRTLDQQSRGYFRHLEKLREKRPDWPYNILRREANRFFHPPDQKAPPGHCTGGAVDVTILGSDGKELDLGSSLKEGIDTNPTHVRGLTHEARANRLLLVRVMTDAGFSNCADEWWHWSYGDNGWAARFDIQPAIYGALVVSAEELALATIEEKPA